MQGTDVDWPVAQEGVEHCDAVDESLGNITSAMFSSLRILLKSSQLYWLKEEELSNLAEEIKCQLETGRLALVFCEEP